MEVRFTKMQGIGNDFVVVDARMGPATDWPEFARRACKRRFGIGADGLLIVGEAPDADAAMLMYNPDGTPDFCGNGLRCVARFVADRKGSGYPATLTLATLAGHKRATVERAGDSVAVTADMGRPEFDPARVPMSVNAQEALDYPLELSDRVLRVSVLSTGSTHAVAFVDALPSDPEFAAVSAEVETHALFPERTSLMWVQHSGEDALRLRIWERGVGETLGCGTGACAAAVAARRKGIVGRTVRVRSAGGELIVNWEPGDTIIMTGPAEYVCEGTMSL